MLETVSTVTIIICLIVFVLLAILFTVIGILFYSGLFNYVEDVGTGKPPFGKAIIAYKFQKGPYKESGQIFTEAAIISPKNKALGIYYDDPRKVEARNLRYAVGSILCEGDGKIDEKEVKRFTDEGFKILNLPEVTYVVRTKFQHTTPLSIIFGIWKAYPELNSYIEERKLCAYPYLEYYDEEFIHFIAPLSKQDQFVVPECEAYRDEASGYDETTLFEETTLNSSRSSYDTNTETEDNMSKDDSMFNSKWAKGDSKFDSFMTSAENESMLDSSHFGCSVDEKSGPNEEESNLCEKAIIHDDTREVCFDGSNIERGT